MNIDIAKLRKLIEDAVEEGAGINEGYRAHGASYDVYEKAIKEAVDDATDEIMALIKQEQNDE